MEIFIILLLALLLTASVYANINLLGKLEKYEDTVDTYEEFIENKAEDYEKLLKRMREIDSRQMFEKDDDVGGIFQQLKKLIEDYKNFE